MVFCYLSYHLCGEFGPLQSEGVIQCRVTTALTTVQVHIATILDRKQNNQVNFVTMFDYIACSQDMGHVSGHW